MAYDVEGEPPLKVDEERLVDVLEDKDEDILAEVLGPSVFGPADILGVEMEDEFELSDDTEVEVA